MTKEFLMLKGLRSLSQAIDKFRAISDAIPARVIHTFVIIAGWEDEEGPSMGDIATAAGLERGVTSRHVGVLTKTYLYKGVTRDGYGLVEEHRDTGDIRIKRIRLTAKGRTLRSQLLTIMEQ